MRATQAVEAQARERRHRRAEALRVLAGRAASPPRHHVQAASVPARDSLALVSIYTATNGTSWSRRTGWLTGPVSAWHGVTIEAGRVVGLDLRSNNLTGSIPAALTNLDSLRTLSLGSNRLSGTIPAALADLAALTELYLYDNNLSGTIPGALGELARLTDLALDFNQLTGSIPRALGDLAALRSLTLGSNQLTGAIPRELGSLAALEELNLSSNQLSGPIPRELGNLTALALLSLRSNALSGNLPFELSTLTTLTSLDLGKNAFTGPIPTELGALTDLTWLDLSENALTGAIPSELGDLALLTHLDLRGNTLTGAIPDALGTLTDLTILDLGQNALTGAIPDALGDLRDLEQLYLEANGLTGALPATIGRLTNLRTLHLHENALSGPLPAAIGSLSALEELDLHANRLDSTLVDALGDLSNLRGLFLQENRFTGTIPAALGDLYRLEQLYLYDNELSGTVPASLGNLTSLRQLSLRGNQLTGLPPLGGLFAFDIVRVENNRLTFESLEPNVPYASEGFVYAPQAAVDTARTVQASAGDRVVLRVGVGGSANRYEWLHDGAELPEAFADSLVLPVVTDADAGTYHLRITNPDVPGLTLQSEPILLSVRAPADAPSAFHPVTPTANSVERTARPLFYWEAATDPNGDPVSYTVHLATSALMTDVVDHPADGHEWTPAFSLDENQQYWWSVTAADTTGRSVTTTPQSFWVDAVNEPPAGFYALLPRDGSTMGPSAPTFIWEPTTDPDPFDAVAYRVEVATDAGFTRVVRAVDAGTLNSASLDTTLGAGTYHWRIVAADGDGLATRSPAFTLRIATPSKTDVDETAELPTAPTLAPAYPNPFNPSTQLRFGLNRPGTVYLAVYDALGRRVATLADGTFAAGWHTVRFEAGAVPSGPYFVLLETQNSRVSRSILLNK